MKDEVRRTGMIISALGASIVLRATYPDLTVGAIKWRRFAPRVADGAVWVVR